MSKISSHRAKHSVYIYLRAVVGERSGGGSDGGGGKPASVTLSYLI